MSPRAAVWDSGDRNAVLSTCPASISRQLALKYLQSSRQLGETTAVSTGLPSWLGTLYRYLEQKTLLSPTKRVNSTASIRDYYDLRSPDHSHPRQGTWFGGRSWRRHLLQRGRLPQRSASATKVSQLTETDVLVKVNCLADKQSFPAKIRLYVVGYFDVIALHAAGITNVVAFLTWHRSRLPSAGVAIPNRNSWYLTLTLMQLGHKQLKAIGEMTSG